ncbi:Mannose-6-phosphate isomerase [Vibrio crassostreae]|uniref:mannose-6-phosphate isomerase n=1 Tax=Vibrio crassostreae TaxID=246167 RepID=A0A0T7D1G1_9VIBR|nr:mannose-6-phosphate isomerase, class I [Vibrio crassostreae]MDH5952901.1 mannose-6-phosphate isomerase, class I [Vibrio crassostreae]ROO55952.1 mannose-6-phosphate isomerase type 1 [Vibrio crassostreae]ROO71338.1 mannose-6-phosphate isomerase type 1 [Vibrio crassostreae]ROO72216.1 mannose-6-phosphate isomerase type 1 [Vibrio crassostreae]ROO73774.1 mannose-6-phosphate isomerase type 1 [Vibrio crassostreae]
MSLFKLDNVIQHYPWGSKQSISELFDIQNPNAEPQAEIWMGAHPRGCSRVADTGQLLSEVLSQDCKGMFGEYTEARFGELPYLFKVLAAETPLSIQVHPSKKKAQLGFERENKLGISLDASNRNYKDPNHKPELVYALTFYKAMNGFRPIQQIIELFKEAEISALDIEISALAINPNSEGLKVFFTSVMTLEGERKKLALEQLYSAYERRPKTAMGREALQYSKGFEQHYVDDIGLFSPLMLNTIELAPGEAMFLHAETPHAYIEGTGLEIMANSDNVLRAGLTPKFIDVPELIDNTCFETTDIEGIKLKPIEKEDKLSFPIPVDDFGFDILSVSEEISQQYLRSAEILFCIGGEVTISTKEHKLMLSSGESAFISNDAGMYEYQGQGILARAYN